MWNILTYCCEYCLSLGIGNFVLSSEFLGSQNKRKIEPSHTSHHAGGGFHTRASPEDPSCGGCGGGKLDMSPVLYSSSLLSYRVTPLGEPCRGRLWGQLRAASNVGPGFQKLLCLLRVVQALPGLHLARCCPLTQGCYP